MSAICEWMKSNNIQGICGEILSFVSMPLIAGRIIDDELVVEEVNDNLREFLHEAIKSLPESADSIFSACAAVVSMK